MDATNGAFAKWIVIWVVVLNAYSLGANCVERFVNYQTWHQLGDSNFGPYHRSQQPYVLGFVVGPLALGLLLQVLLLFDRPQRAPSWIVLTLLGATVVGFVSTITIQIPIHRQLNEGYSQQLVDDLLSTDWIRKLADLVRLLAIVALCQACFF